MKNKKTNQPAAKQAVLRDKKTAKKIRDKFNSLEMTIGGLQQELQETLTYMELRLENLELYVAEIQAELNKHSKSRDVNSRLYYH
ncbi:hypothetical protein K8S19_07495 [bacterium]|nr:hypothetical protein [bacterium]